MGVNSKVKQQSLKFVESVQEAGVPPEETTCPCVLWYLHNEGVLGFRELENIQRVL